MIAVLIVIAVLLLRVCIAAPLAVCRRERDARGSVFRLGCRVQTPARRPGSTSLRPEVDQIATSNREVLTVSVPAQDGITKDVPARVDAVLSFRVVDAGTAAVNGQDYQSSLSRLARTSLHSVLVRAESDDLLSSREDLRPVLTEILDAPSGQPTRVMPHKMARYTAPGPVGPQDASPGEPLAATRGLQDAAGGAQDATGGPQDATGGPQNATGGPQDATGGPQGATGGLQDAAQAETSIEQVEVALESFETLILGNLELLAGWVRDAFGLSNPASGSCSQTSITGKQVVVGWAAMIAVARSGGAASALRESVSAVGGWMQLVVRGRVDASAVPGGELTQQRAAAVEWAILDALPRPVAGPAYFGRREDAGYFRGWDNGVDGIRRGDQATGPSWGSAAYMTGWRDAVRAIERARRGE